MIELDKIYLGDCLELMREIPDNSIDCIICDLPYGETDNKWDIPIDNQSLFAEYRRIIKDEGAILLFGSFKLGTKLLTAAPDLYKYEWVWEKESGTNIGNVNFQPFRVHEYIYVFGKGRCANGIRTPMKYNPQKTEGKPYCIKKGSLSGNWRGLKDFTTNNESGLRHPKTVQFFKRDKSKLHPTQKPVKLLRFLIRTYTDMGGVILDNCIGSGSTAIAAIKENRHFIGMELDDKYYKIATERVNKELQELKILY